MPEKVLVLRTCHADLTSPSNREFRWPESGPVSAPDWMPTQACGNGLHGFLWGEGDAGLALWAPDAKWLVVSVDASTVVDLGGDKVKFPSGEVVCCGTREEATAYLHANGGAGRQIIGLSLTGGDDSTLTGGDGSTLTGGDDSTLTGGDDSTLTGGYRSTLTGGDDSTLTGGDDSTLTGGDGSTLTGGYRSTLTGGDDSTLTGGDGSTLTGGDGSTLTGGDGSTLTGGDGSTLTGGDGSTLTGGYGSTLTVGENGTLIVTWWDDAANRRRIATGVIGEDGLLPNTPYRLVDGKWIAVETAPATNTEPAR